MKFEDCSINCSKNLNFSNWPESTYPSSLVSLTSGLRQNTENKFTKSSKISFFVRVLRTN